MGKYTIGYLKKKFQMKKSKVILLIGLYFALFFAFLILTALYHTAKEKADYIQRYIGNAVSVQASQESMAGLVDYDSIETLKNQPEVADYNTFSNQGNVVFYDIDAYIPNQKKLEDMKKRKMENRRRLEIGDRKDDLRINCGLYGVEESASSVFFLNKNFYLLDGKHITSADAGKENVLISEKLAQINKLQVGDTFHIETDETNMIPSESPYKVKVIGIFRCDIQERESIWPADNSANTVIMHESTLNQKFYHMEEFTFVPGVITLTLFLEQNDMVVPFVEKMNQEYPMLSFSCHDRWAKVAAKPVKDMQRLSGVLSLCTLCGIVTIALLLGLFYLHENLKEIGVFLSLGQSKCKIAIQVLIEEMIPVVIAMSLAMVCALGSVGIIGDRISGESYQESQKIAEQVRKAVGGEQKEGMEDIVLQSVEPERLTMHLDGQIKYSISGRAVLQYLVFGIMMIPLCLGLEMIWIFRCRSVTILLTG